MDGRFESRLKMLKDPPVGAVTILPIRFEIRFSIDATNCSLVIASSMDAAWRKLDASNNDCKKLGGQLCMEA